MALSTRQTALLELLNQLSRNLTNNDQNADTSVDLSGIDLDINLGGGRPNTPNPTCPTPPGPPTTFSEVLASLVNEQVQVTTPFGVVTGTLLVVKNDYTVIIDTSGDQVMIRIDKIELISEL